MFMFTYQVPVQAYKISFSKKLPQRTNSLTANIYQWITYTNDIISKMNTCFEFLGVRALQWCVWSLHTFINGEVRILDKWHKGPIFTYFCKKWAGWVLQSHLKKTHINKKLCALEQETKKGKLIYNKRCWYTIVLLSTTFIIIYLSDNVKVFSDNNGIYWRFSPLGHKTNSSATWRSTIIFISVCSSLSTLFLGIYNYLWFLLLKGSTKLRCIFLLNSILKFTKNCETYFIYSILWFSLLIFSTTP